MDVSSSVWTWKCVTSHCWCLRGQFRFPVAAAITQTWSTLAKLVFQGNITFHQSSPPWVKTVIKYSCKRVCWHQAWSRRSVGRVASCELRTEWGWEGGWWVSRLLMRGKLIRELLQRERRKKGEGGGRDLLSNKQQRGRGRPCWQTLEDDLV